jgi:hypothetical protein
VGSPGPAAESGDLLLLAPDEVTPKPKPAGLTRHRSVVSFKDTTDEIPDMRGACELSYSVPETEEQQSALDSTITLSPGTAALLPGPEGPWCPTQLTLLGEARLLERDKGLAALGQRVLAGKGEADRLLRELADSDINNQQMMNIVGEFEKTIEQLLEEKAKSKENFKIKMEDKREETKQIKCEIEDVERAKKDLTKKYARTKEVITAHIASEAGLKKEVEALHGRHRAGAGRYEVLKVHAETKLQEASGRLEEVGLLWLYLVR